MNKDSLLLQNVQTKTSYHINALLRFLRVLEGTVKQASFHLLLSNLSHSSISPYQDNVLSTQEESEKLLAPGIHVS